MTLVDLLPFVALAAFAWLLLIRPAKVRRDAQARLIASLVPGQQVMTTAGVFGTIVALESDRLHLEIAPGVVIVMLPQAVGQVVGTRSEQVIGTAEEPEPESSAAPPTEQGPADLLRSDEADRG